MWWLTTQSGFIAFIAGLPMAEQFRFIFEKSGSMEIYLPWQMVFYLTTGIISGIVVSISQNP
jgi:hypothetical protein